MFDLYHKKLVLGDEVVYVGGDKYPHNGIVVDFGDKEVLIGHPSGKTYWVKYKENRFYKIK